MGLITIENITTNPIMVGGKRLQAGERREVEENQSILGRIGAGFFKKIELKEKMHELKVGKDLYYNEREEVKEDLQSEIIKKKQKRIK